MRSLGIGCAIGARSGIGEWSFIGCAGGVTIGADVIAGQYVSFHSENHVADDPARPIVVGDGVWIGAKATLLAGARVGPGAIVAAGAVVRGTVPAGAIVGGVPARIIGWRPGFAPSSPAP